MNWKKEAVGELRDYLARKEALEHLRERQAALRLQLEGIRASKSDTTPVMGGGSRVEDGMISRMEELQRLELNYRAAAQLVSLTERGLESLTETQRLVLERFYIYRTPNHVEDLMERLHVERSRVYEIKEEALRQFTIRMYGLTDY